LFERERFVGADLRISKLEEKLVVLEVPEVVHLSQSRVEMRVGIAQVVRENLECVKV
jgi:hypothetical protein